MICLGPHRGLAGVGWGLDWGWGEPGRPNHRRQGKRPAIGPSYVVGWVEEFRRRRSTACCRLGAKKQGYQCPERRRWDLRAGGQL